MAKKIKTDKKGKMIVDWQPSKDPIFDALLQDERWDQAITGKQAKFSFSFPQSDGDYGNEYLITREHKNNFRPLDDFGKRLLRALYTMVGEMSPPLISKSLMMRKQAIRIFASPEPTDVYTAIPPHMCLNSIKEIIRVGTCGL